MQQVYLSIVIPAYNESKNIKKNILEVDRWVKRNNKYPFEIIVVNDGSTDDTKSILNKIKLNIKNLKVIHHDTNFGIFWK